MDIKEFYEKIGGDYNDAISRIPSDSLLVKFTLKFANDPSFDDAKKALDENNLEVAFRSAHTLKGVCKNLSFKKLSDTSSFLTELLRSGNIIEAKEYFIKVQEDYDKVINALNKLN